MKSTVESNDDPISGHQTRKSVADIVLEFIERAKRSGFGWFGEYGNRYGR